MRTQHRSLSIYLPMASACLLLVPAICPAQLVPPGDFRGKSLSQWGFDSTVWALSTRLEGRTLPDNNIFKATFGSSFGSLSFGNVAQPGLSEQFVRSDLSVVGSLAGGWALGDVDLVYIPEPSSILLMALALAALLSGRRNRVWPFRVENGLGAGAN